MSRPCDRTCNLPERGEIDREAGEFWVANPFMMPEEGHNLSAYERNRLFLNVAGRGFLDASYLSATDIDADSRSVVAADFDRDGRIDLLVGSVGGGPLRLFLNRIDRPHHHVLKLSLVGVESNRPAIGSRLILHCGERVIVRDIFPANGCMGQAPPEVLIGLGSAEQVDSLWIRWPNGKWESWEQVPANVETTLVEGTGTPSAAPNPSLLGHTARPAPRETAVRP